MTCKNKMDLYIYTFLILIIQPFSTGHNNEASMVPKNRSKRYIVFPNNSVMQVRNKKVIKMYNFIT